MGVTRGQKKKMVFPAHEVSRGEARSEIADEVARAVTGKVDSEALL